MEECGRINMARMLEWVYIKNEGLHAIAVEVGEFLVRECKEHKHEAAGSQRPVSSRKTLIIQETK